MGFSKEGKPRRLVKTLFFLLTMFISLLLFSAPVLLVIADALLPTALLSASLSPDSPLSLQTVSSHLRNYDFRFSLIDIPLISLIRSAVILCVYSFCDGPSLSRGPYLGVATICSVSSLAFVSLKASFVFGDSKSDRGGYARAMEVALFLCSLGLGIGHVVVAYRTSCRERRKLLVYKIDIEAVSACKIGFTRYHKILQQERVKQGKSEK
ncbi:Regulatory protein [Actinidia chinensis var. chinensis]|uniref:Regulatory protein n=1 Tax=Actinidia chinensis var. chinensis TaxID=1590841 RepID=A0A2R6RWT9_ACTCC|nr:Regulatory protein [Actinidia chinensis var. chinensis]